MEKHFFDFDDGDFAHTISENMAIDSNGDLLMRMGDNMALDMDSGDIHIISSWSKDDDDDNNRDLFGSNKQNLFENEEDDD